VLTLLVWQVREVAAEAIARARRGDGPTLIECETYRFRGHSLADPDELRKKEEKDHYLVGGLPHLL
jgi:pyruvate dehydrogenase E1 component alpha subunit